jgi:hypothetical protein
MGITRSGNATRRKLRSSWNWWVFLKRHVDIA